MIFWIRFDNNYPYLRIAITFWPPLEAVENTVSGPSWENVLDAETNTHCLLLLNACLLFEVMNRRLVKLVAILRMLALAG